MKDVKDNPGFFFQRARMHEIMSGVKKNSEICNENISSEMFPSEPETERDRGMITADFLS